MKTRNDSPQLIPATQFKYSNETDRRTKLHLGKLCGHCFKEMTDETVTLVSERNGFANGYCDFCNDSCNSVSPCKLWFPEMTKFFNENGYVDPARFDSNGKLRELTGFAANYVKKGNKDRHRKGKA